MNFWRVYICPFCDSPTIIGAGDKQYPGIAPGADVGNLPDDVERLYSEARNCIAGSTYTASVLASRKLLLHIASAQKNPDGSTPKLQNFVQAVEHLERLNFIPPHGRVWVDHIRLKSNEANHEIVLMAKEDAENLVTFSEMLLKFIYEFPSKVPAKK